MKKFSLALIMMFFSLPLHARGGDGAIMGPYMAALARCAPGCSPYNYNVWRRGARSCHAQGRAIDVGGLLCGGNVVMASTAKFSQVTACMSQYLGVLYHNGRGRTRGHHDHAHFSIGCSLPGHPNYW